MKLLTTIIFALGLSTVRAQDGAFVPENADPSRPRVLFKWQQLNELQALIVGPHRKQVHWYLTNTAYTFPATQDATYPSRQNAARVGLACSFLLALGLRANLSTDEIYPLDEADRQFLLEKAVLQLHGLVTDVEFLTVNNLSTGSGNWQYDAAILTQSLTSYDLLAALGYGEEVLAPARAKLTDYLQNFYRAAADTIEGVGPVSFFDFIKNNHALKVAGALGLGGVVLGENGDPVPSRQPRRWLETALFVMDNCLWRDPNRQSEPDRIAGYAEGPFYFSYAFVNCLPFIRGLRNYWPHDDSLQVEFRGEARRVRNPYFDPIYDNLYEWFVRTALPDGRTAPIDDSYLDRATLLLAALDKPRYHIPVDFSGFYPTQPLTYGQIISAPLDFGPFYLAALTPFSDFSDRPKIDCFPDAGNAVFRSDFSSDAAFLQVIAENGRARINGAGHNQGDVTSFIFGKNAETLALDPGYVSWGQRNLVGNANNHNLILSGDCGPLIGSPFQPNDADGFLNDLIELPGLAAVEATTRYCSTDVRRDFVFAGERAAFVFDFVDRGTVPTHFRWQLHGNGRAGADLETVGTYEPAEKGGVWRRPRAGLRLHIQSPENCTLSTRLAPHEIAFGQTDEHTALEARVNGQNRAAFLAALIPFDAGMELPVVQAPDVDGAVVAFYDGFAAFAQTEKHPRQFSPPTGADATTDALFVFYDDSTFLFRTGAGGGFFDGFLRVERANAGKTAWSLSGDGLWQGFSTPGPTTIFTGRAPEFVAGADAWSYEPETGRLTLELASSGYVSFRLNDQADALSPVWPGDANDDGVCDVADFFLTAAGYGSAGPARTDAGVEWRAHSASSRWNDFVAYRGASLPSRRLDANGDGEVNLFDLAVCVANRGLSR